LVAAERALSLDPSLADAHAARGRALAELARYDEALAAHEESLRLNPDSFDVRFNFARTCSALGRHEAAVEHYERAAQLAETDYRSLFLAGMSYEALGRHDKAISVTRLALERVEREIAAHPDNAKELVYGVNVLARLGEKERAKQWALRARIIEADDPIHYYNLACALTQMNELEPALDLLESCKPTISPEVVNWMKGDSDLIPLHGHHRFKALIERGEARLALVQAGREIEKEPGLPRRHIGRWNVGLLGSS
jgi:adenylate cyclase